MFKLLNKTLVKKKKLLNGQKEANLGAVPNVLMSYLGTELVSCMFMHFILNLHLFISYIKR